jgi:hypothetical protein
MMKMMRKILSPVLWLGRGTATLMGLAMLLALIVGLASTALAGTGMAARFDLGKVNTVNRISQLVGSTDNALLRIDNDSKGADATALDLRTDSKKPPMKVDSFTRVEKLNADLLDGQSADQFLPLGGKAFDSDKLDGLEPAEIGINGYENVRKEGALDSTSVKSLSAACSPGKEVIGGGAEVFPSNADPNRTNAPIALRTNGPDINGLESWSATALEVEPYPFEWLLFVRVICADTGTP